MTSPTQRSLKKLRSEGYLCAIVEKFNHYVKVRQDLFGFVDLLALRGDVSLYIQTTSGSNVSARVAKIKASPHFATVHCPPSRRVVVHGWRRVGARGKRKVWECREVEVSNP